MPVVNRRVTEKFDVYIGRPGPWGNPFSHLPGKGEVQVATREEAVAQYKAWLWKRMQSDPEFTAKVGSLRGKTLGCWCAPAACHGDVLLAAAEWVAASRRGE